MSEKKDKIIKYITALPPGTKVSVRNLAKDLEVSEGTAYKAIKYAEELKLVETKSRAGTIRIAQDIFSDIKPVTLADEIGRLGLIVLAGAKHTNIPVSRIVLGDGSLEQFRNNILNSGPNTLCLVGGRPDLLHFAVRSKVSVIATSGTQPSELLLAAAEEQGVCVLSSMQDSGTVLNLLNADIKKTYQSSDSDKASSWMRMPPYLYYNDIVADWYSSYKPVFSQGSMCAVVNDDLQICGSIDAVRVLASSPSVKVSSLYSSDRETYIADEATPMQEIAQHMIANETSVAYITRNDVLRGVITANDALRYYQYNLSSGGTAESLPLMEALDSSPQRSVYTIQLENSSQGSTDVLLGIINLAAKRYCTEQFGRDCSFTSGTFYTSSASVPCEIMISCEIKQHTPSGFVLEVEMYSETTSFARCVMLVATEDTEAEKQRNI